MSYVGTTGTNTDFYVNWLTVTPSTTLSACSITAQPTRAGSNVFIASTTGGTAPITIALYRSTTTHFNVTPPTGTTLITSGTSTTLTDSTAVAGEVYWYWAIATDALSTTVTSAAVSGVVADRPSLCLLCIGTSWTYRTPSGGFAPPVWIATYLNNLYGYRTVTAVNSGVGSSKTDDWLSGSSNLTTALAAGAAAYAGMSSGTQKFVHFEHGFNDASSDLLNSTATFKANCQNIFAALISAGWKIIFPYPSFSHNTGQGGPTETAANRDAGNVLRRAYRATVDELVDNVNVFLGSTDVYGYVGARPDLTTDDNNVHPTAAGTQLISLTWAKGVAAAVDKANGIGTTTAGVSATRVFGGL
jgi:lysophospholipase L1-like esterase